MAKSVLGNDPFQRGAAERAPAPEPEPELNVAAPVAELPAEPAESAEKTGASANPTRVSKSKTAPKPAPAKAAARKPGTAKAAARKSAASKPAPSARKTAGKGLASKPVAGPVEPPLPPESTRVEPQAEPPVREAAKLESPSFHAEPGPGLDMPPLRPAQMTERLLGALAIARDMLRQATSSESLSRLSVAVQALFRALTAGLGTFGSAGVDAFGKDEQLSQELKPFFDFLYDTYWRVGVENAGALPSGPVVIVANHAGALPLDGPVLNEAIRRERPDLAGPRWLLEDQIFYAPFLGTLLNRLGAVRACPENALRLLDQGRPVLVFPEGIQGISKPYRERYQLKRFGRGGFVKLALRAGAPIVPAAIVGAEESLPLLTKLPGGPLGLPYFPVTPLGPLPLPVKWSIRFGEPIDLGGGGQRGAEDLARVQALTETTRQTIETMLASLIRERKSVFGG